MQQKYLKRAFFDWYVRFGHFEADSKVLPYLNYELSVSNNWLKNVRESLNLSQATVAKKLTMDRNNYARVERAELSGEIQIKNLKLIAEAMGCELVYAIRPKAGVCFSHLVWQRVLDQALKHPWFVTRPPSAKGVALAYVANKSMLEAKFRKDSGWSKRARVNLDFNLPPERLIMDLGYGDAP